MNKILLVIFIIGAVFGIYQLLRYVKKNGFIDVFAILFIGLSLYLFSKLLMKIMRG